jgi:hypothetical protein
MDRLDGFPPGKDGRRQAMRTPDEVAAMRRLHDLGWGTRRIAAEMGGYALTFVLKYDNSDFLC